MNHSIEISSLTVNKLKDFHANFIKYDIDVALDEVESSESSTKLKYKISLMSNPTNTKLTVEGLASLIGNELEIAKQLEPDQMNIPIIVNVIYQDIFPLFYIISKTLQIPCPSYKLSQISTITPQAKPEEQPVTNEIIQQPDDITIEEVKTEEIELHPEPVSEPVIQEANVS